MGPEASLSIFDQLLILAMFIPAGITLVATLMALVVTFCIVVLAPFNLAVWAATRRGDPD